MIHAVIFDFDGTILDTEMPIYQAWLRTYEQHGQTLTIDEYSAMVSDLVDRFYSGATRYTTNGFLRSKLGDALDRRAVAPYIFETADEASAHLRELEGKAAS